MVGLVTTGTIVGEDAVLASDSFVETSSGVSLVVCGKAVVSSDGGTELARLAVVTRSAVVDSSLVACVCDCRSE